MLSFVLTTNKIKTPGGFADTFPCQQTGTQSSANARRSPRTAEVEVIHQTATANLFCHIEDQYCVTSTKTTVHIYSFVQQAFSTMHGALEPAG